MSTSTRTSRSARPRSERPDQVRRSSTWTEVLLPSLVGLVLLASPELVWAEEASGARPGAADDGGAEGSVRASRATASSTVTVSSSASSTVEAGSGTGAAGASASSTVEAGSGTGAAGASGSSTVEAGSSTGAAGASASSTVEAGSSTGAAGASASSTVAEVRTEKRPKPDLDGRRDPPPDAGDVLIWIPRVVLSPVHLVFEWGVRKPLGALLTLAERDKWAEIIVDFLTFSDRKIGLVPTFFVDFNFRPSVGLYAFWNEAGVEPHSLRFAAGWGGDDWYRLSVVDRWALGDRDQLELAFSFWGRPDYIFTGVGLAGEPDARSRYFREYYEGALRWVSRPWRGSEVRFEAGVQRNRYDDGSADPDELVLTERFPDPADRPAGFDTGYTSSFQRVLAQIDTRKDRPAPGSGALLQAYLTHGWDLEDPERFEWMGYGGTAGLYHDLGNHRVVGMSAQAHLVNPVGDREVPFDELFILGRRPQDLSGFLPGVLRGRSAVVATLEYDYPIWVFIDGSLQLSVGNAFAENFEDFDPEALRTSLGLGLKSTQDRDAAFTLLFAIGSTRFDEPFAVDSFRFVVGTQTGF